MQITVSKVELRRIRFFWFRLGASLIISLLILGAVAQGLLTSNSASPQPTKTTSNAATATSVATYTINSTATTSSVSKPVNSLQTNGEPVTPFKFEMWMLLLFSPFVLGFSTMLLLLTKRAVVRAKDARWHAEISPQTPEQYQEFKQKPANFWNWNKDFALE